MVRLVGDFDASRFRRDGFKKTDCPTTNNLAIGGSDPTELISEETMKMSYDERLKSSKQTDEEAIK
uniref:Uncharacterized protein n=1 Tax=Oryza sativa subsp. japonica TaxID=39947 RepID=Q8H391_ORYSJ|nr:hypothetical protein [Oryza sativa Japonica Group]